MKRSLILSVLIALVASCMTPASAAAANPDVALAILDHPLTAIDGTEVRVGDIEADVVVVTFWASWCKPCKKELPRLQAMEAAMGPKRVRVLAISVDTDPAKAARFLRQNHLSLTAFVDGPQGLARTLDLESLPYTYVLDRERRLVHADGGADDNALAALETAVTRATRTDPDPLLTGRPR